MEHHEVTGTLLGGQKYDGFPRFVQRSGDCPYNFEKNRRKFLESIDYRRNFASEIKNRSKFSFSYDIIDSFHNAFDLVLMVNKNLISIC